MLATACGGDDAGSGNDQAVIDAVVANIRAEDDVPEAVDVECMATSMVSSLGGAAGMEENFGLTVETIANETSLDELNLPKDDAARLPRKHCSARCSAPSANATSIQVHSVSSRIRA